jgi:hypothetical protein
MEILVIFIVVVVALELLGCFRIINILAPSAAAYNVVGVDLLHVVLIGLFRFTCEAVSDLEVSMLVFVTNPRPAMC